MSLRTSSVHDVMKAFLMQMSEPLKQKIKSLTKQEDGLFNILELKHICLKNIKLSMLLKSIV